ncbi:unnamed protein product [Angiostrongylus costaricensis]|uniref:NTR domain-containing protein n=1 Tax=Angiostrongylus costaricensis TaxID=334426 RepID=A0A158PJS8_ANGCS|nr:unnamed protein product [Angiostrongylus costaricensis]
MFNQQKNIIASLNRPGTPNKLIMKVNGRYLLIIKLDERRLSSLAFLIKVSGHFRGDDTLEKEKSGRRYTASISYLRVFLTTTPENYILFYPTLDFPVFRLHCIQCDKNAAWYSEEEHERLLELCQHGLVPPTPCRNHSHTHCIVSWYRSGGSGARCDGDVGFTLFSEKIVTERKCGGVDDVTGCTLYNSKISRKVSTLQSAVIDYYLY